MTVKTTTHLNFRGNAREALDLYASIFGGEVMIFTFGQAGVEAEDAVSDQVIWGGFEAPNGLSLMAMDVPPGRAYDAGKEAVFVSVRGDDPDEIRRCFEVLAEGGNVRTPLGPSLWGSPLYGMLDDRFGVTWVLDVAVPQG